MTKVARGGGRGSVIAVTDGCELRSRGRARGKCVFAEVLRAALRYAGLGHAEPRVSPGAIILRSLRELALRGRWSCGDAGPAGTLVPALFACRSWATCKMQPESQLQHDSFLTACEVPPLRGFGLAFGFANHELEAGPDLVDGADLDIHEAEREGFSADGVFGDVGVDVRGFFGPGDPEDASGREELAESGESYGEVGTAGDEDVGHFEAGLRRAKQDGGGAGLRDVGGYAERHGQAPGALTGFDAEFFGEGGSGVSGGHGKAILCSSSKQAGAGLAREFCALS
jgi:hypothetical protein